MSRRPRRAAALAVAALVVAGGVWIAGGHGFPFLGPACRITIDETLGDKVVVRRVDVAGDVALAVGSRYLAAVGVPLALRRAQDGTWTEVAVPVAADNETVGLHDVVVLPSGEAWAVGSVRAREPFAVRWNGGAVPVETPALGTEAEWLGVGGSPTFGVWAVGKRTDGQRYRTLVGRAEGDRFVIVPSPNVGEGSNVLADVDVAGDDAWAVGWSFGADGRFHPLAMRLVDGRWEIADVPAPDGDAFLSTVVAVGDGTAWAVGWRGATADAARPLVLRYDGAVWTIVAGPDATWARLLGADLVGGRLVVVGDVRDAERRSLPAAWVTGQGTAWDPVSVGGDGSRWLTGVAASGPDGLVATGSAFDDALATSGFLASGC